MRRAAGRKSVGSSFFNPCMLLRVPPLQPVRWGRSFLGKRRPMPALRRWSMPHWARWERFGPRFHWGNALRRWCDNSTLPCFAGYVLGSVRRHVPSVRRQGCDHPGWGGIMDIHEQSRIFFQGDNHRLLAGFLYISDRLTIL